MNSYSLCLSVNVFISPSFFKDSFTRNRILGWQVFFFPHAFWPPRFLMRNMFIILLEPDLHGTSLSGLVAFKILFAFQQLDCKVPWGGSLIVDPPWSSLSFSDGYNHIFHPILEISAIISSNNPSVSFPPLYLLLLGRCVCCFCSWHPHRSRQLCSFSFNLFSFCFSRDKFNFPILMFANSSEMYF